MSRTEANRGIAKYPNSPLYNKRIAETRVCPICGEAKTPYSMACWWCVGQSDPASRRGDPEAALGHRVIHALARRYPSDKRPADNVLIAWGQGHSDRDLMKFRDIGIKAIRWLRSQSVDWANEPPQGSYEAGFRDGIEAARRSLDGLL